jgi:hypothetical protein
MSERWFVQSHAGTGLIQPIRSVSLVSTGPQYVLGGGVGFKTYAHAFLFSAERNVSDGYGYGASSNLSWTAGWTLSRPGRTWQIQASGGAQRLCTLGLPDFTGWLINTGFTQRLTGNAFMTVTYAYLRNQTNLLGGTAYRPIHSVRVAFGWAPSRVGL